jgi:hypothetical protein
MYRTLAAYPFGGSETPRPPGTAAALDFGEPDDDGRPMYVARPLNDGFELWLGYRHQWLFTCRAADARRLAWFVLWRWWVVGTWCGLRRWLWYRALRRVNRLAATRSH